MEEFPSVKGIQLKKGKDKVQVLLLSVDLGYGMDAAKAGESDQKKMTAEGVGDWPNVLLPNGFKDTQRLFNLDGYGLTLIDPEGIVRGVDIGDEEARELLSKI